MPDGNDNPYIRTYAKDVAALSGAPPPSASAVESEPAAPQGEGREAVLARLRDRAAQPGLTELEKGAVMPRTMPTPVPSVRVTESSPPVPAPSFVPPPEPVAPISLETVSPIHTYASDFSDRIDVKNASAFSVLAEQADTRQPIEVAPETKKKTRTNVFLLCAGALLILLAVGGGYLTYRYVAVHKAVPLAPTASSLIFAEDRQALTGEGTTLMQALVDSAGTPLPDGQVRIVYLTQASTTSSGSVFANPLPGGEFFGALQLPAPDILLRNIDPSSTVGIVHAGNETRAFFVLRVLSYESTFAGMLNWEPSLSADLAPLYPAYPAPPLPPPTIATTTTIVKGRKVVATTTIAATPVPQNPPAFIDEVASNHNVRALRDAQNRTILLYGYYDKQTLIIARDEAAFALIVNRLAATSQQ